MVRVWLKRFWDVLGMWRHQGRSQEQCDVPDVLVGVQCSVRLVRERSHFVGNRMRRHSFAKLTRNPFLGGPFSKMWHVLVFLWVFLQDPPKATWYQLPSSRLRWPPYLLQCKWLQWTPPKPPASRTAPAPPSPRSSRGICGGRPCATCACWHGKMAPGTKWPRCWRLGEGVCSFWPLSRRNGRAF